MIRRRLFTTAPRAPRFVRAAALWLFSMAVVLALGALAAYGTTPTT